MTCHEVLAQLVELDICIPNTHELKSPSPIKKECSMHDMNELIKDALVNPDTILGLKKNLHVSLSLWLWIASLLLIE